MTTFNIGHGLLAGFNAIQEISLMPAVVARGVTGFVLGILGPLLGLCWFRFGLYLRPADWMPTGQDPGDEVIWIDLGVAPDFKSSARDGQGAHRSMKQ
jgi:hypothetical protein